MEEQIYLITIISFMEQKGDIIHHRLIQIKNIPLMSFKSLLFSEQFSLRRLHKKALLSFKNVLKPLNRCHVV